jgi:hypothetical protein
MTNKGKRRVKYKEVYPATLAISSYSNDNEGE